MDNKIFIDLDKEIELPEINMFNGKYTIKKNGKILVKDSVLENIDTLSIEELIYTLSTLKKYISPICTSIYIPSSEHMQIIKKIAPDFKVRFKTEKPGSNSIPAISCDEFFEGEKIFIDILKNMPSELNEMQKFRYLYNQVCMKLSYNVNVLIPDIYASKQEKKARNIYTSISKNWGICSSFAAIYDYLCYKSGLETEIISEDAHDYVVFSDKNGYDYLADPTFDSINMKFGLRSKNYAISKQDFELNNHNLLETTASEYIFESLSQEEIEKLDKDCRYLELFNGQYQDEFIDNLGNNLKGSNNFEKITYFIKRLSNIKVQGRPEIYDYEELLKRIIRKSKDINFKNHVKAYSYIYEYSKNLPRNLAIEVSDLNFPNKKDFYIFEKNLKEFKKTNAIEIVKNLPIERE